MDFPPRPDGVDFRTQLENKYLAMGRRPSQVIVDMEGEATWVGEYYRYRVNGCDHNTATQRVMTQVDGGAPGQVCSLLVFPETAVYPPRDQIVDFRRQLGTKYQSMGRSAQSAVDPDGAAIWLGEYYRYRTSGCDHATATQKVMTQIDGGAAPPSCAVAVRVSRHHAGVGLGRRRFVRRRPAPHVGLVRLGGGHRHTVDHADAAAHGDRSQPAVVHGCGQSHDRRAAFGIRSGSCIPEASRTSTSSRGRVTYKLAFQFFDPATSTAPTMECLLRTTSTICTLSAVTATLPAAMASYDWKVEYAYGGLKTRTQVGPLPTFSFTESCGVAPPEGIRDPDHRHAEGHRCGRQHRDDLFRPGDAAAAADALLQLFVRAVAFQPLTAGGDDYGNPIRVRPADNGPVTLDATRVALDKLDARLRILLPEQYQESYESVQPVSMGSAGLKFAADGQVAWDEIWQSFCDLAMAGGPPHKGALLAPGDPRGRSPRTRTRTTRSPTRSAAASGWPPIFPRSPTRIQAGCACSATTRRWPIG